MTQGTKVTTDPESTRNPIQEGTGVVTSDSLAAQSVEAGGSFGAGAHPAVSGQPSKGTTANTTDTSGATTLPPAANVESRAGFGDEAFGRQLRESGGDSTGAGFGAPAFKESLEKSSGGSSSSGSGAGSTGQGGAGFGDESFAEVLKGGGGDSQGAGFSAPGFKDSLAAQQGSPVEGQGGAAPSYTAIEQLRREEQVPKGEDLKEGVFDTSAPNASNNSDIGSKQDPGRVAVEKFARQDAVAGADAGNSGPKQTSVSGDGQFDVLSSEKAA